MSEQRVKESKGSGYSAPIVYKAFAVLKEVAKDPGSLGISDLSRVLNMNKSTLFGVTQALLDLGALRQDGTNKKFKLGPALIQLGNQSLAGISLRSLARPFMVKLAEEFMQTVFLGRIDEYGITIIEKAESPADLKVSAPVGARIPFFAAAVAKTFLASFDEFQQRRILQERTIPKFTEKSITDEDEYVAELKRVRAAGFATDFEEYIHGVHAVSVPLLDARGWLIAAIWVVGFSTAFPEEKMLKVAAAAKAAVKEISSMMEGS